MQVLSRYTPAKKGFLSIIWWYLKNPFVYETQTTVFVNIKRNMCVYNMWIRLIVKDFTVVWGFFASNFYDTGKTGILKAHLKPTLHCTEKVLLVKCANVNCFEDHSMVKSGNKIYEKILQ